jgi:hypothetical protein
VSCIISRSPGKGGREFPTDSPNLQKSHGIKGGFQPQIPSLSACSRRHETATTKWSGRYCQP